ncbi:MAG: 50S ribosomal protein L18 [Candidatus Bipolaricaulota bacterium]|nr:MAG: 50S ribosomal protein L18 [Candidatus Bipolaricaulota bacterium]
MMARVDRRAERRKRHLRVRKRVTGTAERPRLCVRKSLRHVYAQLVDDQAGRVLVTASTLDPAVRGDVHGRNVDAAGKVGALIAARAAEKGIEHAVFDRGGYPYHGVVAALADACREGGLRF